MTEVLELSINERKIPVRVSEINPGSFLIWSGDLNIWGEGRSKDEAIKDFLRNAKELYHDLKKDQGKLGPAMEKIWKFLSAG